MVPQHCILAGEHVMRPAKNGFMKGQHELLLIFYKQKARQKTAQKRMSIDKLGSTHRVKSIPELKVQVRQYKVPTQVQFGLAQGLK